MALEIRLYKDVAPDFFAAAQRAFASADNFFRAAGFITQKDFVVRVMVRGSPLGTPPRTSDVSRQRHVRHLLLHLLAGGIGAVQVG